MKRTIIVVDDNEMDRNLLKEQLKDEYLILEATNGQDFLRRLKEEHSQISAVILDIIMPVMDGFEALRTMRQVKAYMNIPVIIISVNNDLDAKKKAIEYGANGFLSKPYDPYLIRKSLENIITFRENAALLSTLSTDRLTGMISHELFFDECDKLIQNHEPGYYTMSCIDINQFKIINDQYGMEVGDQVLIHIADCINTCCKKLGGLACRYSADRFAALYPVSAANSSIVAESHKSAVNPPCIPYPIRLRIGRYLIKDLSLGAVMIYERATVAEESIKGRYDIYIAEYDDSMRARILHEQRIVNEMDEALSSGQFIPFFQPQYNHATGALIGAEALVRWKKGDTFVAPYEFIPIFERNGFVYEVDKCIWEQVCILLRKWLDEDKKPLPVSVNISRVDLFREDFLETICGLIEKYRLPVNLLRLEVTESAFSDSSEQIINIVNQLIQYGFTIEIDDFGSGYSSLNTLKDVPASILKLDMRFFSNTKNAVRSNNIIESVVRMAKWIDMIVIAEGVEKKEQADYLRSIGCYYIQGYLYAKPMPVEDYEKCCNDVRTSGVTDITDITDITEECLGDVTELYMALQKEHKRSLQLKFLNDSAHDILAQPDTRLAINGTLKKLLDYFDSDRSYVIELDYQQMISANTYEVCAQNVNSQMQNLQEVPFTYHDFWYESLSKNHTFMIDDVDSLQDNEKELRELLKMQDIQSLIMVSLMRDGKLIGLLGLDNPKKERDQTEQLKAVSDYIAILLTRRDLNQSIERSKQEKMEMEEEYRLAALHSGRTIGRYNVEKETLTITTEDARRLELPECIEDVPYGRIRLGKISPDTAEAYKTFYNNIKKGKPEGTVMFQKVLPEGWRWISAHSTTIFSEEGTPVAAVISYLDITDSYEKDAIYTKWQQSLENRPDSSYSLFRCDLSQNASYDISEGRLIRFKYREGKNLSFDECTKLYANEHVYQQDRDEYQDTLGVEKLKEDYRNGKRRAILEYREIVNQANVKWIRRSVDLVGRPDSDGVIAYLMFEDIDKSKREELDIKTLAETDAMTGLLNRKAFEERMTKAIAEQEDGTLLAFFILDLDIFKQINDTLGHAEGDKVLIETSKIIHSALWDCDLVGRLGGDEFVFCMLNVPNKDIIRKKARRIWKLTHRIINDSLTLSSSIGIAVCPEDGSSFEELYAMADKALYMVKENGKDNYGFYSHFKGAKEVK